MTEVYERKTAQFVGLWFETKPISVNAIWRSVRGRNIKSKAYREWVEAAGAELEAQQPYCVPGSYGVRIALCKGCRLDADNAAKPFIDLIRNHNVVDGDGPKHLRKLEIWHGVDERTMVQIISTRGEQ